MRCRFVGFCRFADVCRFAGFFGCGRRAAVGLADFGGFEGFEGFDAFGRVRFAVFRTFLVGVDTSSAWALVNGR